MNMKYKIKHYLFLKLNNVIVKFYQILNNMNGILLKEFQVPQLWMHHTLNDHKTENDQHDKNENGDIYPWLILQFKFLPAKFFLF